MSAYGLPKGGAEYRKRANGLFTLDNKPTIDPPDDDFALGVLNPKWTAVSGTPGVCDLLYTGGGRYDLTTRPGWLLIQGKNSAEVTLRQDYTLPDGHSIVAKVAPALAITGAPGITNLELYLGIAVNNNDTRFDSGLVFETWFGAILNGWRMNSYGGTVVSGPGNGVPISQVIYLRIARSGLTYYAFYSGDGTTWNVLGSQALASAMNNVWLWVAGDATTHTPTPVMAIDWFREGTNGVDPWPVS